MPVRLLLIDAMNLIRRLYAGIPGEDSEPKARQCQQQSLNKIARLASQLEATHTLVVFDGQQESWRHRLYPEYKAHRSPMPQPLASQLPLMREAMTSAGIPFYLPDDLEADDVIATLACKVTSHQGEAVIASTDQGYGQLLTSDRPGIEQYDAFARHWMDADFYRQKHVIPPHRLPELFALTGHHGNQIPGVPGIGPKTALSLLTEYPDHPTLESLLTADELPPRWRNKLAQHQQLARLSQQLATLKTDLSLGINLQSMRYIPPHTAA